MIILNIVSQSRRDFLAEYECEHCGNIKECYGYDDSYFHAEVIPKMKCEKCGKTSKEDYTPLTPKYPDGMQV